MEKRVRVVHSVSGSEAWLLPHQLATYAKRGWRPDSTGPDPTEPDPTEPEPDSEEDDDE